jgi:hypothetical protein
MKFKHNKKRNTAFLYESLVRELIKNVMKKDESKKQLTIDLMKRFFHAGSPLGKELRLYKALYETTNLQPIDAEKLLHEAKMAYFGYGFASPQQIHDEQSQLIATVNKRLSPEVFSNFVPNYKSLATIQQIFSKEISLPNRIMLERKVIDDLCSTKLIIEKKEEKVKLNDLIVKTAIKTFNKKYEGLNENQKKLISKFVTRDEESEPELRFFVAEEFSRIKDKLATSLTIKEFKEDKLMQEKAKRTLSLINETIKKEIDEESVALLLKLQELEKELN